MNSEILLELGRVVYLNFGPLAGKCAVVVDIVNGTKVVIDGPGLGVEKQVVSTRRLELTKFRLGDFKKGDSQNDLKKKIEQFDLQKRFSAAGVGKRIAKQQKRASLGDFDRFRVHVLKRKLSKAVRSHVNKNRKALLSRASK